MKGMHTATCLPKISLLTAPFCLAGLLLRIKEKTGFFCCWRPQYPNIWLVYFDATALRNLLWNRWSPGNQSWEGSWGSRLCSGQESFRNCWPRTGSWKNTGKRRAGLWGGKAMCHHFCNTCCDPSPPLIHLPIQRFSTGTSGHHHRWPTIRASVTYFNAKVSQLSKSSHSWSMSAEVNAPTCLCCPLFKGHLLPVQWENFCHSSQDIKVMSVCVLFASGWIQSYLQLIQSRLKSDWPSCCPKTQPCRWVHLDSPGSSKAGLKAHLQTKCCSSPGQQIFSAAPMHADAMPVTLARTACTLWLQKALKIIKLCLQSVYVPSCLLRNSGDYKLISAAHHQKLKLELTRGSGTIQKYSKYCSQLPPCSTWNITHPGKIKGAYTSLAAGS